MEVIIAPKGKLFLKEWSPRIRDYTMKDVTKKSYRFLSEHCTIEKGVVLKDIFLLLNKNIELYDKVFGNWCKDIVEEGLMKPDKDLDLDIDFLEVYWTLYGETDEKTKKIKLSGNIFPEFHGIGVAKEDESFYKKGEIINYGVSFSKPSSLAHLPLVINKEKIFTDLDFSGKQLGIEDSYLSYSLNHILYSIIWELSFHGGPVERQKQKDKILGIVDKINKKNK